MSITVNVTETDIRRGRPRSLTECPVALALCRTTHQRWYVTDEHCVNWDDPPRGFPTSSEIVHFMRAFDRLEPVQPFSFDLDLEVAS